MAIGTYISLITLNVNGLNAPAKRHRLAEWIQKQDPYLSCVQETHFRPKDTYRLKVKGWKEIFHANGKQKKARVAILISDKIDVTIKTIKASACNKGDLGLIPGSGRSPGEGNGNPLQYSCLENHMDGGAWWLQRVGHD